MTFASLALMGGLGIAGAAGAVARYLVGRFIAQKITGKFPLGTLLINIFGAFLIGVVFALTTRKIISLATQSILATGFLGGFTTFSTMSWEGVQLAKMGQTLRSCLYLSGTFALGLGAELLGMALGRVLF